MASTTSTTISSRFAGPPFAVNGGYAAGILAERANLRAAHVQLKAPVPLETPIQIRADNPGASIVHNGRTLITASPATLLDRTHPAVDFVSAALAAGGTDPSSHPFPSCFVCVVRTALPTTGCTCFPDRSPKTQSQCRGARPRGKQTPLGPFRCAWSRPPSTARLLSQCSAPAGRHFSLR
jgi:hypothetical protein